MRLELSDEQRSELLSLASAHVHLNTIVDDETDLTDAVADRKTEWARDIVAHAFNTDSTLDDTTRWTLEDAVERAIEGEYQWQYALALHAKAMSQAHTAPRETAAQADAKADADAVPPDYETIVIVNNEHYA